MPEITETAEAHSKRHSHRDGRWVVAIGLGLLVIAVAAWRFGRTTADPDLWGHLLTGLETLDAGSYVSVDRWSYLTEGQAWINHPWLGQVVMALAYHHFGSAGLVVLKSVLALGVVAVLYWWLIRKGLEPVRAAMVGLLAVLVLTPTLGTFRPQVFTVVCAVVLLLVMVGVDSGRIRLLWFLPPLFALWANLHGGYLAGLAIVAVWAVIHLWRDRSRFRYAPFAAVTASVLASFSNPQGWGRLTFLLETATVSRPEIQDWQPIDVTSPVGIGYLILSAAMIAALWVDREHVNWALGLPLLALIVAPLGAWRHLQLFAPAIVILGAAHLSKLSDETGSGHSHGGLDHGRGRAVAGALALTVAAAGAGLGGFASCIRVDASQFEIPQRAAVAWARVGPEGNAVVPFNWGEYIRWHFGPEILVSTDGRRETIYSEEVHQANLDFMEGRANWEDLLELAPADWIIAPTASPVVDLVPGWDEWNVVYQDSTATLFSHEMVDLTGDDQTPVDGHGSCFPAGPTVRSGETYLGNG